MSKFLHKIRVWLYKNLLTPAPDDYSGRTQVERTFDVAEVSHLAETRGGSSIKAEDLTRSVNIWLKEMAYQLCDNNAVNTGYFYAKMHLHGTFKLSDKYDPKRHHLLIEFQQGALLRKELEEADVIIEGVADTTPHIDTVHDYASDTSNQGLTPGGMLEVKGFHLKFLPEQDDNGLFLVPVAGGDAIKLAPVPTNKPQQLISQCPLSISGGEYWLEVRTTYISSGIPLKSLKTGRFATILTVPVA
jgi:hypothetical protein